MIDCFLTGYTFNISECTDPWGCSFPIPGAVQTDAERYFQDIGGGIKHRADHWTTWLSRFLPTLRFSNFTIGMTLIY